jgi:hypothetical protein
MNDDELITVLLEQRGKVPMTTPVEQIISRGRAVRARRRAPQAAAALGTAAAAAIAVTAALPASHAALPASHPDASQPAASHPSGSGPGARLAAWTVTKLADGSIQVTLHEAADPAGLQRTLRADGVPVSVTFAGQQNPACRPYGPGGAPQWPFGGKKGSGVVGWSTSKDAFSSRDVLVIHPSAMPSGGGLQIEVMQGIPSSPSGPWPYPKGSGHPVLEYSVVKASPQCTGS